MVNDLSRHERSWEMFSELGKSYEITVRVPLRSLVRNVKYDCIHPLRYSCNYVPPNISQGSDRYLRRLSFQTKSEKNIFATDTAEIFGMIS